jgi:hypothetical protein
MSQKYMSTEVRQTRGRGGESGQALVEWLVCTSLMAGIAIFCATGLPMILAKAVAALLAGLRSPAP